ncbi:hypothetical protein AAEO56_07005 [Flavobacterium sp. DGU11]|uniref:Uncharacterized protein n=1 Tax=Flavobacterium arundinis TaxID=3139143 RepID=A0ABU9HV61_9FLAO
MDRNNPSKSGCMQGISDNAKVALDKICTIIANTIETDAVYCLGYRNTSTIMNTGIFIRGNQSEHIHFYLVVFVKVKRKNSLAKLNQEIRKRAGSHTTATFLVHTTAALQEIKGKQCTIFFTGSSNK